MDDLLPALLRSKLDQLPALLAFGWARQAPLYLLWPWLALRVQPGALGVLLSALGTLALAPLLLLAPVAAPVLPLSAAVLCELVRGSLIALGCALPFAVFELGGSLSDALRGAWISPLVPSPLGAVYAFGAGVLALGAAARFGALAALIELVYSVPFGSGFAPLSNANLHANLFGWVRLFSRAFELGVAAAAPVLLGVFVSMLLLGFFARAAAAPARAFASVGLVPWLGLGIACLSAGSLLEELPALFGYFVQHTARLTGALR